MHEFIQCRIKLHEQYLNEMECTLKITGENLVDAANIQEQQKV